MTSFGWEKLRCQVQCVKTVSCGPSGFNDSVAD